MGIQPKISVSCFLHTKRQFVKLFLTTIPETQIRGLRVPPIEVSPSQKSNIKLFHYISCQLLVASSYSELISISKVHNFKNHSMVDMLKYASFPFFLSRNIDFLLRTIV